MISDLGEFFRMGIKKGEEFIPLYQEMEFEKSYLSLYEHRLGDKLKVVWNIGDELECYLLPKILLQPLLENAIHHGIQEKEDGGSISITGSKVNDDLVLSVSDDGPGISREKLETIRRNLAGKLSGNSIGIYNVQKRIHLYYGMEYGLEIHSITGGGTTVSMRLPATRQQLPAISGKR
jgi:two-component system sensor histidine kinase YesM